MQHQRMAVCEVNSSVFTGSYLNHISQAVLGADQKLDMSLPISVDVTVAGIKCPDVGNSREFIAGQAFLGL